MKFENDNRFHLAKAPRNKAVRIKTLDGPDEECGRLLDLGFTPGEEIVVTQSAPLGDPLVIRVRGALLALRRREASWIVVE